MRTELCFGPAFCVVCSTKTNYTTFSICLSVKAPHTITKCPDKNLQPNTECPKALKIVQGDGKPVSETCLKYYPAFRAPS